MSPTPTDSSGNAPPGAVPSPAALPRRVDPLVWGSGPRVLEVFLEPTCPFSGRAFGKFDELLARAGEGRLTLKIRLQSQPWHCFSPTLTRAVLAAATTAGGKEAAWSVLAAVFARRDDFEPKDHCQGPLLDHAPAALLRALEQHTGLALREAYEDPALTLEQKWQARYARQNGIHVTPTFMVDGLVAADLSSGDTVDVWLGKLGLG